MGLKEIILIFLRIFCYIIWYVRGTKETVIDTELTEHPPTFGGDNGHPPPPPPPPPTRVLTCVVSYVCTRVAQKVKII